MDPVQLLMDEHRLILSTLDALEGYVRGKCTDRSDFRRFIEFIRLFADARHHGKEEKILFAEMEAGGFPAHQGPLGVMYQEHELGRNLVATMAITSEGDKEPTPGQWEKARDAAEEYIELLRGHIQKEDQVLYPMAQAHLTAESWEKITGLCTTFEAEQGDPGGFRKTAEDLIRRYGNVTVSQNQTSSPQNTQSSQC